MTIMKLPWTAPPDMPPVDDREIYGDVASLAALDSIAATMRSHTPQDDDSMQAAELSIAAARSVL